MKSYALIEWLEVCRAKRGKKFYDMGGEKYINCVTDNTLFQSNTSVNVFKVDIYI